MLLKVNIDRSRPQYNISTEVNSNTTQPNVPKGMFKMSNFEFGLGHSRPLMYMYMYNVRVFVFQYCV